MKNNEEIEITRDEVRKEFQLERMTLFSDAVFAIVMTLMAIEIRLPEHLDIITHEDFTNSLIHLLPVLIAYAVSFSFIGSMWYEHLKTFSLLKDYDKGLVTRNLIFLFLIGLFPFSATLVSKVQNDLQMPLFIYLGVILICRVAQFFLQDYIFNKRPELRMNTNIDKEIAEFKRNKFSTITMVIVFAIIAITNMLIAPEYKLYSMLWVVLYRFMIWIYDKKNSKTSLLSKQ